MARTDALFLATEEYNNTFDGVYPYETAQNVESAWNDDVATDDDYDISISLDGYVKLNDPSTTTEAIREVNNNSTVSQKLNSYDAVVVIDDRNVSGGTGRALVGHAGEDEAVAYCESASIQTAAHELGHIYGASHRDDQNGGTHWQNFGAFSHDVMGYDGVDPSCKGNEPDLVRENRYWDCAREKIRETIDSNL
jgi:hypothetical protein